MTVHIDLLSKETFDRNCLQTVNIKTRFRHAMLKQVDLCFVIPEEELIGDCPTPASLL